MSTLEKALSLNYYEMQKLSGEKNFPNIMSCFVNMVIAYYDMTNIKNLFFYIDI